jgi:tetratricopeptide (TPR) repeat protein
VSTLTERTLRLMPILAATVLLQGCALLQTSATQTGAADLGPGVEVRPDAPAEYDVLVAQQHEARGDIVPALAAYRRALAKDPNSAYLHRKMANDLFRTGRPGDALEHAQRAFEIEPGDARSRILLGQLYRLRKDTPAVEEALQGESGEPISDEAGMLLYQVYLETDEPERAVEIAQWLIDRDDDALMGYAALAKALERMERFEEAEAALRKGLDRDPGNLQIYSQLARSARERGEPDAERAVYGEILELHPHHHSTLLALADVQLGQDDLDGALKTLTEIEKHYPEDLRSMVRLGFLHYEAENFGESALRFEAYLEAESADSEVAFFLGIVRRRQGEDEAAIEAFLSIPPDSEHYAEARTQLAVLYERSGEFAGALEEVTLAIAANPTRPRELYSATLRAKSGDFAGAVSYLEGLLLRHPEDDELLYNLGVVYGEAKHTGEAIEYMERAIERNPNNASALNYVGYTWAEQGSNLDQAEAYIVRALDLRPDDGFITDSLGWVYYMRARPLFDTGREAEAQRYIERALEELLRAQELTGGDPVVSEHLGDAYLLLDQKRRALEKYLEAMELTPRQGEQPNLLEKLESLQREFE